MGAAASADAAILRPAAEYIAIRSLSFPAAFLAGVLRRGPVGEGGSWGSRDAAWRRGRAWARPGLRGAPACRMRPACAQRLGGFAARLGCFAPPVARPTLRPCVRASSLGRASS